MREKASSYKLAIAVSDITAALCQESHGISGSVRRTSGHQLAVVERRINGMADDLLDLASHPRVRRDGHALPAISIGGWATLSPRSRVRCRSRQRLLRSGL